MSDATAALARAITRAGSKQTYYGFAVYLHRTRWPCGPGEPV